jgi:hypothetical protein
MWRTQRPSPIDIICLSAGALLLLLVPVVFFAAWLIEPLIRPLVGAVPTPIMWLIFAGIVPLGLSLLMVPLLRRIRRPRTRWAAQFALLLICLMWMMVLSPPRIRSASVVGTAGGTLIGLAILQLLGRRPRNDPSAAFPVTVRDS